MGNSLSILIIDGRQDDVDLTVYALRASTAMGSIDIARDGRTALDLLHVTGYPGGSPHDRLQLILLELDLPDISGLDLLRAIKTSPQSCGVPVIVFAARLSDGEVLEASDLGAAGCVEKPVSFAAFQATVAGFARFAADTRAVPPMRSAAPQRDLIVGPTH